VKKTTNYGSCRDLHGRRLRDVQNERRLTDWSEKKKTSVEQEWVISNNSAEEKEEGEDKVVIKKERVQEKWELETKQITVGVGNSVEKGLALMKEKELKRKREEDNNDTTKIKFFGLSDEEDEVSDSDSDSNKEPEKKKLCPELVKSPVYPCTTSLEHTPLENTSTLSSLGPPVGSKRTAAEISLEY